MTYITRIVFLSLSLLLLGCHFQKAEDFYSTSSHNLSDYAENLAFSGQEVHYNGQFEYTLHECEGPHSEHLSESSHRGYLQITVNRDRVKFLRRDKTQRLNVLVTSSWNRQTQSLSRLKGVFGIAQTEDWRTAIGVLQLSKDDVSGQITHIQIIHRNNFCDVLFRFRGVVSVAPKQEE